MKQVLVIGGTGGLGSKLVKELLQHTSYELQSAGSKDLDLTDGEAVRNYFIHNKIDVVVNLAGKNSNSFMHKYDLKTEDDIHRMINVNIMGTVNLLRGCLPGMRERNFGRIILASSILAEKAVVGTGVYSGCKGFIDSITRTTALENAGKNITCNSLQLGYFDGGLTYEIPESFREQIQNSIPMKRWGSPEELYETVEFLINTPYITGQNLAINGGIL